jgi:hypothetical protein
MTTPAPKPADAMTRGGALVAAVLADVHQTEGRQAVIQMAREILYGASAVIVREAGVESALQTLRMAETVAWKL